MASLVLSVLLFGIKKWIRNKMTRKCYVCRRHIGEKETFFVNPVNAKLADSGVAFCMECIPPQK
jgi:hypothetical protein